MAIIPNTTPVTAPIAPLDSNDTYPVTSAMYLQGGFESVENIAARDAIPAARRTGKLVRVKDKGDGTVGYFTYGGGWQPEAFAEDKNTGTVAFSKGFGVIADNNTGAQISGNRFVMIMPLNGGAFGMVPITKAMGYKGELFGYIRSNVADGTTGFVELVTTIQTGITASVADGDAYIGFDSVGADAEVVIGTKGTFSDQFGKCGIFGATNDIGEFYVSFNAFKVQAERLLQANLSAGIDYHDSLPAVISKEALFVYLIGDLATTSGTVQQDLPPLDEVQHGTQIVIENQSASVNAKIQLVCSGTDRIDGARTYDVSGGNHRIILIATHNSWMKLFDSSIHSGGDLASQVSTNTAGIAANRNIIRTINDNAALLPMYVFKDRGIPTLPDTTVQKYKAYYIHIIVLPDNNQVIQIPVGTPDNTIFSIENNDRSREVSLRPPTGETIDGNVGLFTCGSATLCFFVKDGDNWQIAYGGIFPSTLASLRSTVQALISDQIHTMDEIETGLLAKGFIKGITVTDGITNAQNIQTVDLQGIEVVSKDTPGTAVIRSTVEVNSDAGTGGTANKLYLEAPLEGYIDPNAPADSPQVKMFIKHGYYERKHAPSYLAYLKDSTTILGKASEGSYHKGIVAFEDVRKGAGPYIVVDRKNKAYGIQEWDEKDPNITGGDYFFIAFYASFDGVAPDDGFIRMGMINKNAAPTDVNEGYLIDATGKPLVAQTHYKQGDTLEPLLVSGIVNAKGLKEFQCYVADNFTNDYISLQDLTAGGTGLVIQAFGTDDKLGDSLIQFEEDLGLDFKWTSHYMGVDRMTLDWILRHPMPVQIGDAGTGQTMNDGFHFYNLTRMKMGIRDSALIFEDDGTDKCDFNFGKIFSAEETLMMRGKQERVTITAIEDDLNTYYVGLVKWIGTPNKYPKEIFKARANSVPAYEPGWSLVDEDTVVGGRTTVKTFVIPNDANNYAYIIYPNEGQIPMSLKITEFKADVLEPFTGFVELQTELDGEKHLVTDEGFKRFVQDNQSFASLRYTLNDSTDGYPMPCGIPKSGKANVQLDNTVNQVVGSGASGGEGAIQALNAGNITLKTKLRVSSEQATTATTEVRFWWALVSPDGATYTKLPDSETIFNVKGGTKNAEFPMRTFTYAAAQGDRFALRATTDKADGAFIESTSPKLPMVQVDVTFDELTETAIRLNLLEQRADEVEFIKDGVPVTNYRMRVDVNTGSFVIEEVK